MLISLAVHLVAQGEKLSHYGVNRNTSQCVI